MTSGLDTRPRKCVSASRICIYAVGDTDTTSLLVFNAITINSTDVRRLRELDEQRGALIRISLRPVLLRVQPILSVDVIYFYGLLFNARYIGGGNGFGAGGQNFVSRPVPLRGLQPSIPAYRRRHAHRRARLSRYIGPLFIALLSLLAAYKYRPPPYIPSLLSDPKFIRNRFPIFIYFFLLTPFFLRSPPTGLDLRLDILDTGGSYVFPAMRTLAIKSADGFVLVCASDDPSSLEVSLHFSFFFFVHLPD